MRQQLPSCRCVVLVDDNLDGTASCEPARPGTGRYVCLAIGAPDAVGSEHSAEHLGFRLVVDDGKGDKAHIGGR